MRGKAIRNGDQISAVNQAIRWEKETFIEMNLSQSTPGIRFQV
jgi:hypothetical protein